MKLCNIDIIVTIIYIIGSILTFIFMAKKYGTEENTSSYDGIAWLGIMFIWPIVLFIEFICYISDTTDSIAHKIYIKSNEDKEL